MDPPAQQAAPGSEPIADPAAAAEGPSAAAAGGSPFSLGQLVRTARAVTAGGCGPVPVGTLCVVTALPHAGPSALPPGCVAEVRGGGYTFFAEGGDLEEDAPRHRPRLGQCVRAARSIEVDQDCIEAFQIGVVTALPGDTHFAAPPGALCEVRIGGTTFTAYPGDVDPVCAAAEPPQRLLVRCPPLHCFDGEYELLQDAHNGRALWGCGERRLYAASHGNWALGLSADSPLKDTAWAAAREGGAGLHPQLMRLWTYYGPQGEWLHTDEIAITEIEAPAAEPAEDSLPQPAASGLQSELAALQAERQGAAAATEALAARCALLEAAAGEAAGLREEFTEVRAELRQLQAVRAAEEELRERLAAQELELRALRDARTADAARRSSSTEIRGMIAERGSEIKELGLSAAELRDAGAARDAAFAAFQQQQAERDADLRELIAKRSAELSGLRAEQAAAAAELRALADTQGGELAELRAALSAQEAAHAELKAHSTTQVDALAELKSDIAAQRAELDALRQRLDMADSLRSSLDTLESLRGFGERLAALETAMRQGPSGSAAVARAAALRDAGGAITTTRHVH